MLHFGALAQQEVLNSLAKVSQMLRIPKSTVQYVIKRFVENGNQILSRKQFAGRKRMVLPDAVSQWLLSRAGLQECAGLSLQQRTDILHARYGCDIAVKTLGRFYGRNGIRFGKAKLVYSQALLDVHSLEQQRRDYARQLGGLIAEGAPLVYVDETTFHTWLRKTHSWQRPSEQVYIKLNPKRVGKCTLYGAIGACLARPVFYVGQSTNKVDFVKFLEQVKAALGDIRPVLVYDNHPSHIKPLAVREYIHSNFSPLRLPTYSCDFNSIEKVWSQLKAKFKSEMAQRTLDITDRQELEALVLRIASQHSVAKIQNTVRANADFILSKLI